MLTLNSFRQKVISASTPIVYSSNSGGSSDISVVAAILVISASTNYIMAHKWCDETPPFSSS